MAVRARRLGRLSGAIARLDSADDAFLDHFRRKAVKGALEGIPRVDVLAVDPRLAILPMHVIAEEHLIELMHVRIIREHDVPGVIEREPLLLNGAAPTADAVILLDQYRVLAEMIG